MNCQESAKTRQPVNLGGLKAGVSLLIRKTPFADERLQSRCGFFSDLAAGTFYAQRPLIILRALFSGTGN